MIMSCRGHRPKAAESAYVAENCTLIGRVLLEESSSVWFGAVLRGDQSLIQIGRGSNIQELCILHADAGQPCIVGDGVTVGHGAILHSCQVGDNCLIGMGATVLNGAVLGANSIVGAGTLITKGMDVPEGSLVLGVPGKVARSLTEEEVESNRRAGAEYVRLAAEMANEKSVNLLRIPVGRKNVQSEAEEE